MHFIIDANLPNASKPVISALRQQFGLCVCEKIFTGLSDEDIYEKAKRDRADLILTRDSDFEVFVKDDLKRREKEKDQGRGIPKVVFLAKNNGMSASALDAFLENAYIDMKRFARLKNPHGLIELHYHSIEPETLNIILAKPRRLSAQP